MPVLRRCSKPFGRQAFPSLSPYKLFWWWRRFLILAHQIYWIEWAFGNSTHTLCSSPLSRGARLCGDVTALPVDAKVLKQSTPLCWVSDAEIDYVHHFIAFHGLNYGMVGHPKKPLWRTGDFKLARFGARLHLPLEGNHYSLRRPHAIIETGGFFIN
nr:hypothetical protein Iba_chr03bCG5840 [Ipomoea batatas]